MGNNVSIPDCFVLSQLPPEKFAELLAEDFTVIRTSGQQQTGWRSPSVTHGCHEGQWTKYHAHVWDSTVEDSGVKKWRFHMVRDAPNEAHVCGWRYCQPGNRTFWPTRLTTEEEKEAWWAMLDSLVATLKRTRQMSDAEWIPLWEAQKKKEEEAYEDWEQRAEEAPQNKEAQAGDEDDERAERIANIQARREAARALDPEMAARHAFWAEFDAERARLMEKLTQLRQETGNNPELQEELTAFIDLYGNEHTLADNLQKRMLQQRKDAEVRTKLNERGRVLKELDDAEQAAVARKDYGAAERAQAQKKTAREYWAEEDAKAAK